MTFDIDADGILHVSAKDLGTGKEAKITITASTKLTPEEKERMIREAEKYAEQDRKAREEAEARNLADSVIYTAEKTLKEIGDKLSKEQRDSVEKAVKELKEALSGRDVEKIKRKTEDLRKVLQEAGTVIYQQAAQQYAQQQAQQQQQTSGAQGSGERKTVETDYRVVDEEKSKKP